MTSQETGVDVPADIGAAADELTERFGENLSAVLWHGSRVRGEAMPGSDEDLILIFEHVDEGVLLGLRGVFVGREGKWSAYTLSRAELAEMPMASRMQFAHGFVVIRGEFEPLEVTRDQLMEELRSHAAEVRFLCRDKIMNDSENWWYHLRQVRYMAKLGIVAMKARHLLETGEYAGTRARLREVMADSRDVAMIDMVEQWEERKDAFEDDPLPVILEVEAFSRRLTEWISAHVSRREAARPSTGSG